MDNPYFLQLIIQAINGVQKELERQNKILQNISEKLPFDSFGHVRNIDKDKEKENDNL